VQAEAITASLAPDWGGAEFTVRAMAAVQDLVPEAITAEVIERQALKQATFLGREVVERMPSLQDGVLMWVDKLSKGKFTVDLDTSSLNKQVEALRGIAMLVTAGLLVAGLSIASALAVSVSGTPDSPLASLAGFTRVLFVAATGTGLVLVAWLLYTIVRPPGRRRRDPLR
jgi:hypothetical protein